MWHWILTIQFIFRLCISQPLVANVRIYGFEWSVVDRPQHSNNVASLLALETHHFGFPQDDATSWQSAAIAFDPKLNEAQPFMINMNVLNANHLGNSIISLGISLQDSPFLVMPFRLKSHSDSLHYFANILNATSFSLATKFSIDFQNFSHFIVSGFEFVAIPQSNSVISPIPTVASQRCFNGSWLITQNNSLCISVCPAGYFDVNGTCRRCATDCQTCDNNSACSSCPSGKVLIANGSCVDSCFSGQYNNSYGICQSCDPSCSTCWGPSSHSCTSCYPSFNLSAVQSCVLSPISTITPTVSPSMTPNTTSTMSPTSIPSTAAPLTVPPTEPPIAPTDAATATPTLPTIIVTQNESTIPPTVPPNTPPVSIAPTDAATTIAPLPTIEVSQNQSHQSISNLVWTELPSLPSELGEVCNAILDVQSSPVLFTMGQNSDSIFRFNLHSSVFLTTAAPRFISGNHHACDVISNTLFVAGGFDNSGNSMDALQIYSPDSDSWTFGAPIPIGTGSPSSATIQSTLYLCGGIIGGMGGNTTNTCWKYSILSNTWTSIASMPIGINHGAAVSDGMRYVYFINGRSGRNVPSAGFNSNQRFDTHTDSWTIIAPSPMARGGMGRAAWLFGNVALLGGETTHSPSAIDGSNTNYTFYRCDVYNTGLDSWNVDEEGNALPLSLSQVDGGGCMDMPIGMHGIYPVTVGNTLYISGGGVHMGASQSALVFKFS